MSMPGASQAELTEQVIADRRHLHAHPELAFEEHQTADFVAKRLKALGFEVKTGVAKTGVVGVLRGGRPGRCVLLRADMDALPIQEENDVPYRSTVPGVMHACGHDGHVAILLGVARVLRERRDRLAGSVKLVFQPSEERGPGGAITMIDEGVLEAPQVDAAFALHLASLYPVGTVVAQPGPRYASADAFRIEIVGKGGGAATAHLAIDPILTAAHVVTAVNSIVGREVNPAERAVIIIGMIEAGTAPNVIPSTAILRGTVRTYSQELRRRLVRRIEEVATGAAAMMGANATFHSPEGCPPVVNDPAMSALAAEVARQVVGAEQVIPGTPVMAGDDMAYILERVPGCYFQVGTTNEALGLKGPQHQPRHDIDEAALPIGIEMFVRIVERYLGD